MKAVMNDIIISDSSDDESDWLKISPHYLGSHCGWGTLTDNNKIESWTTRIRKRHRWNRCKYIAMKKRMNEMIAAVDLTKYAWANPTNRPAFEAGDRVNIASDRYKTTSGKVIKRVARNIYKVKLDDLHGIVTFPAELLQKVLATSEERHTHFSFEINQLVDVQKRFWSGINREGGVGRVIASNPPLFSSRPCADEMTSDYDSDIDLHCTYDIKYSLGGREKDVPAKYILPTDLLDRDSVKRSTQGRCRVENCNSFIVDCKHPQPGQENETARGARALDIANGLWLRRQMAVSGRTDFAAATSKSDHPLCPQNITSDRITPSSIAVNIPQLFFSDDLFYWEREEVMSALSPNVIPATRSGVNCGTTSKASNIVTKSIKAKRKVTTRRKATSSRLLRKNGFGRPKKGEILVTTSYVEKCHGIVVISESEDSAVGFSSADEDDDTDEHVCAVVAEVAAAERDPRIELEGDSSNRSGISRSQHTSPGPDSGRHAGCYQDTLPHIPLSTYLPLREVTHVDVSPPLHPSQIPNTTTTAHGDVGHVVPMTATSATTNTDAISKPLQSSNKRIGQQSSTCSGSIGVSKGYFTASDINEQPLDVRPYLRQILMKLSLAQALIELRARLDRLQRYISDCSEYQKNAQFLLQRFRHGDHSMSKSDVKKLFEEEYDSFSKFDLKVQRKAIDVTNVILRKLEKKDDSDETLATRQSTLIDAFDIVRQNVRKLHVDIRKKLADDFSDADSESSAAESVICPADNSLYSRRPKRCRLKESARRSHSGVVSSRYYAADVDGYFYSDEKRRRVQESQEDSSMEQSYDSDRSFISVRDDVFILKDHNEKKSASEHKRKGPFNFQNSKSGQDDNTMSSMYYYIDDSIDDFIVDDIPGPHGLHRAHKTAPRPSVRVTASISRQLDKMIYASMAQTVFGLPMDMMYADDTIPVHILSSPDNRFICNINFGMEARSAAHTRARIKVEALLLEHDQNVVRAIEDLFRALERLGKRPRDSEAIRERFLSLVHMAEFLWEYFALQRESLLITFLDQCYWLELRLLQHHIGGCDDSTGETGQSLENWLSSGEVRKPFGLFSFLRRKAIWVTLAQHRYQIASQNCATASTETSRLIESLNRSNYVTGLLLSVGIIIYSSEIGALQKDMLRVLLRKNASQGSSEDRASLAIDIDSTVVRLSDMYGVDSALAIAFDIMQCAVNMHHSYFEDIAHLSVASGCTLETAKLSQLKQYKWERFNIHMLDIQMCLTHHHSNVRICALLSSYINSIRNMPGEASDMTIPRLPCFGGAQSIVSYDGQKKYDFAFWVGSVVHSFALYSVVGAKPCISGGGKTIPDNWKVVKDITKDIHDIAWLSVWMARVSSLLPLWTNASAGYDLFRDLLTRLIRDVPWSETGAIMCGRRRDIDDELPSLPGGFLVDLENAVLDFVPGFAPVASLNSPSYSHTTSLTESQSGCKGSRSTPDKILQALFLALGEEPPVPSGEVNMVLSTNDYAYAMIPVATSVFERGTAHLTHTGAPFKRIKNRICQLHTICQMGSTTCETSKKWIYSELLVFIQVLSSALKRFGHDVDVYNQSLHDNIMKLLAGTSGTPSREKLLVTFTAVWSVYLPVQTYAIDTDTTLFVAKGSEFIQRTLVSSLRNTLLHDVNHGKTASKLNRITCLMALAICASLIVGVSVRGFRDEDEAVVQCIHSWGCQAIGPGFYTSIASIKAADGVYLQTGLNLLHGFYEKLLRHVQSSPNAIRNNIVDYVIKRQRDLETTIATILPHMIDTCRERKHEFKLCPAWKTVLRITTILSTQFLIIAYSEHTNTYNLRGALTHTLDLLDNTVSASLSGDDFPLEIWLKGAFWGHTLPPLLLGQDRMNPTCGINDLLREATRDVVLKLIEPNHNVFITWMGILCTIFAEPSILEDLRFADFHKCVLSTFLLNRPGSTGKCIFSEACQRVLILTSFSALSISRFAMDDCMLCLHHVLLSCSVSTHLRPATERSRLKTIFKPIRDVLERCAEFLQSRCSRGGACGKDSAIFRRAVHTICGPLLANDMAFISEADGMAKHMSHIHEAYIVLQTEKHLREHSVKQSSRLSEPPDDTVQFTLHFRSYVLSTSFFSFASTYSAWKPLLALIYHARTLGNCAARVFFTRLCALSLCSPDCSLDENNAALFKSAIPKTWQACYGEKDYRQMALPSAYAISLYELDNPSTPPSPSGGAPKNPYEIRMTGASRKATISAQYGNYYGDCMTKLQVLRRYLLTNDTAWSKQKLDMNSDAVFQSTLTATRIDVIVDFCALVLSLSEKSKHNSDILTELCNQVLIICHISCLRLLLIMSGESVCVVMGDISDPVSRSMHECVNDILTCGLTLAHSKNDSSGGNLRSIHRNMLISWKQAISAAIGVVTSASDNLLTDLTAVDSASRVLGNSMQGMPQMDMQLHSEWERLASLLKEKVARGKNTFVNSLSPDQTHRLLRWQETDLIYLASV